jgi:hypothetical protein
MLLKEQDNSAALEVTCCEWHIQAIPGSKICKKEFTKKKNNYVSSNVAMDT